MNIKICPKCCKEKELHYFHKRKESKDGHQSCCKKCASKRDKKYYETHKEARKKICARHQGKYYNSRHYYRKRQKERLKTDVNYKLRMTLRNRMNSAIKGEYKSGSAVSDLGCSIEELKKHLESKFQSGMTWDNHGLHGWHIDHIEPLSKFDLTNKEEFNKACHYTNLQPLWAKDNRSKGINMSVDTKKCLICKRHNQTLHWHRDVDTGDLWVWCQGLCQRGYSIYNYCYRAGLPLAEFLKGDFNIKEAPPNEVNKIEWPSRYIPLSDPRAAEGVKYLSTRNIEPNGDIYYDMDKNGIIFPYYFKNVFVGAQIRYIDPFDDIKMGTIPGTRIGLLFYNWNQDKFMTDIKGVIITEGAFNALAIQQSFNKMYGGIINNPWRCIACSGSGATKHHLEKAKELKDSGIKVILAPDTDEAGAKMFEKFMDAGAITHYAFTETGSIDWNDVLTGMGQEQFAKWFLGRICAAPSKAVSS